MKTQAPLLGPTPVTKTRAVTVLEALAITNLRQMLDQYAKKVHKRNYSLHSNKILVRKLNRGIHQVGRKVFRSIQCVRLG